MDNAGLRFVGVCALSLGCLTAVRAIAAEAVWAKRTATANWSAVDSWKDVGCRTVETLPAGDVCLTEPWKVTAADSGKVFRGAADGSTRIVGGLTVTNWTDRGDGVWGAKLPQGADGRPVFTETLFVNGRRTTRARFPDTGYFHVTGVTQDVWTASATTNRIRLALPPDAAAKVAAVPSDELPWAQAVVHVKWDAARYPIESFAVWAKRVKDEGSVFADPGFADWRARNFVLRSDSPALKAGFRPFDPSLAGRIPR